MPEIAHALLQREIGVGTTQLNPNEGNIDPLVGEFEPSILMALAQKDNIAVNTSMYLNRPIFAPDKDFSRAEAFKATPLAMSNPSYFFGIDSQAEWDARFAQVSQEMANNKVINSYGIASFFIQVAMAPLDPLSYTPGGGYVKGAGLVKALARSVGIGFTTALVEETILHPFQVTRTYEESMLNIAATSVFAGMLGASIHGLTGREIEASIDRLTSEEITLSLLQVGPQPVGAAVSPRTDVLGLDPGALEKGIFTNTLAKLNPLHRSIQQKLSTTIRNMAWNLGDGGLKSETAVHGVAPAPGGNIEQIVKQHEQATMRAGQVNRQIFKKYQVEGGAMARKEFSQAVGKALDGDDPSLDKFVNEAASMWRNDVYLPTYHAAKEAQLPGFKDITPEQAQKYFTHDYDSRLVAANRANVEAMFKQNAITRLTEQATARMAASVKKVEGLRKQADEAADAAEAKTLRIEADYEAEDIFDRLRDSGNKAGRNDPFDFAVQAGNVAHEITEKISAVSHKHSYFTILSEMGPEKARTLNIDPKKEWLMEDGSTFRLGDIINYNVEESAGKYMRVMAPDIELMRKFGSIQPLKPGLKTAAEPDGEIGPFLKAIQNDFRKSKDELLARPAKTAKEQAKKNKAIAALPSAQAKILEDMQTLIDRTRNIRGMPTDPSSVAYRAGRLARQANNLTKMGSVVLTSIPDFFRPMMKHGFIRTMEHGLIPLITNFKSFKGSLRELRLAGEAVELWEHGMVGKTLQDFDDFGIQSRPEEWMTFASNRMALWNGLKHWNTAMKNLDAHIVMGRIQDDITMLADGTGSVRKRKLAQRFLSGLNLDPAMQKRIQVQTSKKDGSDTLTDGTVRWPNTEEWTDIGAQRAYRAALAQDVSNTIVTPGLELPSWMDASATVGPTLAQFRSFTFSATMKVMQAAGQDLRAGDMAPIIGMTLMVASAAFSVMIKAELKGGKAKEDFYKLSTAQIIELAIDKSGVVGLGSEVVSRLPYFHDALGIETGRDARAFAGGSVAETLIGPSGGLAQDFVTVADMIFQSVTEDGEVKERHKNALRRLGPFQNMFYLNGALHGADAMGYDLPNFLLPK